ncbi:MAG TPA: hypothetical protein VIF14_04055 [Alphaproteobacteria bacterium]|jgi:hypothetical protein
MRKIGCAAIMLGALAVAGAESSAFAAMGQCYDAYGRPVGPPHNTDNPPYDLICRVYRIGGSCTHVQPAWAENNCGPGPRYPLYRRSPYTYGPGFPERPRYYHPGYPSPAQPYQQYPHTGTPGMGSCPFPDIERCHEGQRAPGN